MKENATATETIEIMGRTFTVEATGHGSCPFTLKNRGRSYTASRRRGQPWLMTLIHHSLTFSELHLDGKLVILTDPNGKLEVVA